MSVQEITIPRARLSDPKTSWDAAGSVDDVTATQAIILMLLRERPMTDEQLVFEYNAGVVRGDYLAKSPSGIRSRRAELVRKGLVVDNGVRGLMSTGRTAIVWQVSK